MGCFSGLKSRRMKNATGTINKFWKIKLRLIIIKNTSEYVIDELDAAVTDKFDSIKVLLFFSQSNT